MSVQSVGNNQVQFKSRNGFSSESAFVNMDDDQLRHMAYNMDNHEGSSEKFQKSLSNTFYAIPVVSTIASGILGPKVYTKTIIKHPEINGVIFSKFTQSHTSLGERASVMGKCAGIWALAILGVTAYNKIKKSVAAESNSLKDFTQNNPVLSFMADIGIILGGFILGYKGLSKAKNSVTQKAPEIFEHIGKAKDEFLKYLDNTHFNQKILPSWEEKAANFAEKAPITSGIGKFAIAYSPFIVFGLWIYKALKYQSNESKRFEKKYNALKDIQLETAKNLVNRLGVERDILAQDQRKLSKDFNKAVERGARFESEEMEEAFAF